MLTKCIALSPWIEIYPVDRVVQPLNKWCWVVKKLFPVVDSSSFGDYPHPNDQARR